MCRVLWSICIVFLSAIAAFSETSSDLDQTQKHLGAVGRLNLPGGSFCTAALVAPDMVLTAGHCLFERETNRRYRDDEITFFAGWQDGRAKASRGIIASVVHPDFHNGHDGVDGALANDLALLRLASAIHDRRLRPFSVGPHPETGRLVDVVSYAHDRAEAPLRQKGCQIMSRQQQTLILTCIVDFGASGAPVLRISGDKVHLVSVISAKAKVEGRPVSIGTDLVQPLSEMQQRLAWHVGDIERAALQ